MSRPTVAARSGRLMAFSHPSVGYSDTVEERMKRRLVGAVVLVSLAVIFLPMLLEDPKDYSVHLDRSNVPSPPTAERPFKSVVLPMSDDEPLIPPLPPLREGAPAAVPPAVTALPAYPSPPPRVGVSAWVVQVASLANREKAERLQGEMRKQGFSAFLEPIQSGGQELLRVRAGPEVDRARAEEMAADIEKKIGLKGQVVRYP